jgi:hypothetical protein
LIGKVSNGRTDTFAARKGIVAEGAPHWMRPQPRASKFLELVFQLFVGHLERIFFDLVLLLAQQTRTISAASRPAPTRPRQR